MNHMSVVEYMRGTVLILVFLQVHSSTEVTLHLACFHELAHSLLDYDYPFD